MKVKLTKRGGIAGGIRWPARVVESSRLSEQTARELAGLVAAVKAEATIPVDSSGRARDAMIYTILIDENEGEPSTIKQSDTMMSPSFAALLQWLDQLTEDI